MVSLYDGCPPLGSLVIVSLVDLLRKFCFSCSRLSRSVEFSAHVVFCTMYTYNVYLKHTKGSKNWAKETGGKGGMGDIYLCLSYLD